MSVQSSVYEVHKSSAYNAVIYTVLVAVGALYANSANAGGFLADTFIRPLSPSVADAADGVSAGIRDRSSDASVYNHVFGGLGQYNNGFRAATPSAVALPPAPAPVLGNVCVTPVGAYSGPWNPVGMPCSVQTPGGFVWGQVMQL